MDRVHNLKQALPYIQQHRGKIFVIKLGGRIFKKPEALRALSQDIVLLHNVGIHVVIVHGGGPQLNELATRLDVPQRIVNGRRVTDERTLDLAKMTFRGKLNLERVSALREAGALAVGLSGNDGGLIEATRRPPVDVVKEDGSVSQVDFGHVGDITKINPELVSVLIEANYVPVICALGATRTGGVLNINADTIAQRLATAFGADKLFLLTDQQGLFERLGDPSSLVSYCDREDLEKMLHDGIISGGMKPKALAALAALEGGVNKVHMVSAFQPSSLLLEVFTNEGCGTLIVSHKHEGVES